MKSTLALRLAISILFTVLLSVGSTSAQALDSAVYKKLFELRTERKHSDAIDFLTDLIAASPTNAELYLQRSEFQLLEAKIPEALSDINKAIDLKPQEPTYLLRRARINGSAFGLYPYRRDFMTAMKNDINSALSIEPVAYSSLRYAAEMLEFAGEWPEAIKQADRFVDRIDLQRFAYQTRAVSKFRLKDYRGSLEDGLKSVELIPAMFPKLDQYTFRGVEYPRGKEFKVIEQILRVYLKDDKHASDYYLRAISLYEAGLKDYQSIVVADPRTKTGATIYGESPTSPLTRLLDNYASFLEEKGEYKKSEKQLDRLVALNPIWFGLNSRAKFFQKRGRFKDAIADLTTAIEYAEKDPKRWGYERIFFAMGLVPNYPQWLAMLLELRADLYSSTSNFVNAVADYEKAIEVSPGSKEKIAGKLEAVRAKLQ